MLARGFQEVAVGLARETPLQRGERRLDVADQAQVDRHALADRRAVMVDLHHLGVGRVEIAIREIGAEHHQRVAGLQRVVTRAEADQARHADIERVVPFDVLLAAQGVDDRRAERVGQRHHLVVRAGAAAAAQQRDALRAVEQRRQRVELGRWRHARRDLVADLARRRFGYRLQRDVAGQHDHGHAALLDRGADRPIEHARELLRVADQLDEVAALAEQLLRMRFLEVAEPDLRGRDVRRDREHRHMVALAVEQAVDQVQVAGAAAARADRELARHRGFGAGREGGGFLVARMRPADLAEPAQAVGQPVQAVARDAPDSLDAAVG